MDPNMNTTRVETFAGSTEGHADGFGLQAQFREPTGLALAPDGSLLVTEASHRIRRVWSNGQVTTVAGTGTSGSTNGTGDVAQFNDPRGVAVTDGGWIYVADQYNHTIRRIVLTGTDPRAPASYTVSTVAGAAGISGSTDGEGIIAKFNQPTQLAADNDGRIYVADMGNGAVRVLSVTSGLWVTAATLATGLPVCTGVALDRAHNVYVAESISHRITRVSPTGAKVQLMGGTSGFTDGRNGTMSYPMCLAVERTGTLLLTDNGNHAVRAIQRILETTAP
jgi:hypothetical protein